MSLKLRSTNQRVFTFPWTAETRCPWASGYERVIIPYTAAELRRSRKYKAHIQIVSRHNLILVQNS